MNATRLIQNHDWRFMCHNNIRICRYHGFGMIVGYSEELHTTYLYSLVLKEMNVTRQVLYPLCLP